MTKEKEYSDKIATMIASTCFTLLVIAVWSYVACTNPTIYFVFGNFVVFVFLFWFNVLYYKTGLNKRFFYTLLFVLMLSIDFMVRKYGDGQHDQVGKALCDITFIVTFASVSLSMFIYSYKCYPKPIVNEIKNNKILFRKEIVYLIVNILVFFALFALFSMESFAIF